MLTWDRKFKEKVRKLGISVELYRRYVDDILVFLHPVRRVWIYDPVKNKMEYMAESNQSECEEVRAMDVLMNIANSIDSHVQFTTDVPNAHPDKRMPVLDLKI